MLLQRGDLGAKLCLKKKITASSCPREIRKHQILSGKITKLKMLSKLNEPGERQKGWVRGEGEQTARMVRTELSIESNLRPDERSTPEAHLCKREECGRNEGNRGGSKVGEPGQKPEIGVFLLPLAHCDTRGEVIGGVAPSKKATGRKISRKPYWTIESPGVSQSILRAVKKSNMLKRGEGGNKLP